MNKGFLALSLLSLAGHMLSVTPEVINSTVLHIVDGTARINLLKIISFRKFLRGLHFLDKKITITGVHYSIRDLVEAEKNHSLPQQELNNAFKLAIDLFAEYAVPYMQDAKGSEDIVRTLVKQWCLQRGRSSSLLLEWCELSTDAQTMFYKNIKSLSDLSVFMDDLETFLADFIQSCPKSLEKLKQAQSHKN